MEIQTQKPIPQCVLDTINTLLKPYGATLADVSASTRRYMTAKQASIYSGLCQKTIRDRARDNAYESIRIGNTRKSRVLIDKDSFDQWLNGFKHKPTPKPEALNV